MVNVQVLIDELGADVNQTDITGYHPLYNAAQNGDLKMVRFLLKSRADVNKAVDDGMNDGLTPLMAASANKHAEVCIWLIKAGADPQAVMHFPGGDATATAAELSRVAGASAAQIAYLEAKTHCSNPGCSGAGLMKCTGCKQARYCQQQCQQVHWKAHKVECKRWTAELTGKGCKNGK
jgi:hypothetical protein